MGISEKLGEMMDCPAVRVVMNGRDEVRVTGHAGLFSYETACIRVRTPLGLLTVLGDGMVIDYFGARDLSVRGRVRQLSLEEDGAACGSER